MSKWNRKPNGSPGGEEEACESQCGHKRRHCGCEVLAALQRVSVRLGDGDFDLDLAIDCSTHSFLSRFVYAHVPLRHSQNAMSRTRKDSLVSGQCGRRWKGCFPNLLVDTLRQFGVGQFAFENFLDDVDDVFVGYLIRTPLTALVAFLAIDCADTAWRR